MCYAVASPTAGDIKEVLEHERGAGQRAGAGAHDRRGQRVGNQRACGVGRDSWNFLFFATPISHFRRRHCGHGPCDTRPEELAAAVGRADGGPGAAQHVFVL